MAPAPSYHVGTKLELDKDCNKYSTHGGQWIVIAEVHNTIDGGHPDLTFRVLCSEADADIVEADEPSAPTPTAAWIRPLDEAPLPVAQRPRVETQQSLFPETEPDAEHPVSSSGQSESTVQGPAGIGAGGGHGTYANATGDVPVSFR